MACRAHAVDQGGCHQTPRSCLTIRCQGVPKSVSVSEHTFSHGPCPVPLLARRSVADGEVRAYSAGRSKQGVIDFAKDGWKRITPQDWFWSPMGPYLKIRGGAMSAISSFAVRPSCRTLPPPLLHTCKSQNAVTAPGAGRSIWHP